MVVLAVVGAALGGWAVTCLALRRPPAALLRPPHLRENFRGAEIPGTLGVLLVWALVFGGSVGAALAIAGEAAWREVAATAGAGAALGLLGLLDDIRGGERGGGFAGHLRALRSGRVTTGLLKAMGGGVVGLAASWGIGADGVMVLAGGGVVALSANLLNLLDLRPGRALKAWLPWFVGLAVARPPAGALAVACALGGGVVAFLPTDLGERGMLGDAGANLAGAVLGVLAVASLGRTSLLVLLGILVALNGGSEVISFDRVIRRAGPLRLIDRLGRRP